MAKSNVPSPEDMKEHLAFVLYVKGRSSEEIGELLDIPAGTIRSWKSRNKWDLGVQEAMALIEVKEPPAQNEQVVAAIETQEEIKKEYVENISHVAKTLGRHAKRMLAEEIIEHAPKLDAADKMIGRRLKLDTEEQAGNGNHISLTFLGTGAESAVKIISKETLPIN